MGAVTSAIWVGISHWLLKDFYFCCPCISCQLLLFRLRWLSKLGPSSLSWQLLQYSSPKCYLWKFHLKLRSIKEWKILLQLCML